MTSDSEGRFLVRSLPPFGRYHAVAIDYLDDADLLDSELLERLSQGASPVSLTDGGKQTLELRCCVTR